MAMVYRTFSPKVARYHADGAGRDMYIATDSGGAYKVSSHTSDNPSPRSPRQYSPKSTRSEAKPFKYHSDGTGRDTYIL